MAVRMKNDKLIYADGLGSAPSLMADFFGDSTDDKPGGVVNGSTFTETDTGKYFLYNEKSETWIEVTGGSSGGGGSDE